MINFKFKNIKDEYLIEENKNILYLDSKKKVNDFFENIILVDSIVLKEEKESLIFYSILSEEEKKIFNISSYFDSIDIAYNYYRIIKELYYNNISYEMLELEKWQEKYIKAIYNIHNKMVEKKLKENIMPTYLIYHDYKINNKYIEQYEKIVFINKMYTNKKELEILNKLNIEVEYLLFTNEKDFNKEKMILENITIEKLDNNLVANSFTDLNSMLIYLTENLSKYTDIEKLYINDIAENKEYQNISCNFLNWHKKNYLNKSKSYELLNNIYEIEKSVDYNSKKIELSSIYFAILNKDFVDFFNIEQKDIENVKKDYSNTKKYANIESYEFIKEIIGCDVFNLCDDIAKRYTNEADKFLEAVSEIYVLKDFNLLKYINKNKDIYKLILKYLDAKKETYKLNTKKFEINKPSEKIKDIYFLLNAQENINTNIREYILDSNQRKKLNLEKSSDFKYVNYYPFIRQIYLSKNVNILYLKNIENDIDIKSVFKSLLIENNIKSKDNVYSSKDLKKHFYYISPNRNDIKDNKNFLTKKDYINVEKDDFEEIKINAYSISNFMEDLMSYILKKYIDKNSYDYINIDNSSISNITIGNIIHEIIETGLTKKVANIQELKKIKDNILYKYQDYIKKEYFKIYSVILFDKILDEILKYIKKYMNYEVETEKNIKLNLENNISINYRIDTLFKNEDNKYIISDIKTGLNKDNISYDYQVNMYKTFFQYAENKEIIKTLLYYPFDNNEEKEVVENNFSYQDFINRVNTVRYLKQIHIGDKILDYNLKNIIREVKSDES